ncbi:uncharacterized protein LOC132743946 [Ruditapes philippinarum]|uniref:uncharacterized protein LOC132743946 n=1 Tax=Ruditapes philippinarum TaxID=129788 RepID=UPI00295BF909|nr:uncharacterized protein LOC132743946 [Ruditapes philippinarum]
MRIYGWGDQALNYIKRMRIAIDNGTTNHWVSMDGTLNSIDKLVGSSVMDSPMYEPLNETLENTNLPEANKTALKQTANLTMPSFRESFKTLHRFILEEYKNATRNGYGVNSLPNGVEYYKACLKWHLSIDISPEEIHQKGLQEVARINKEMQQVMTGLNYTGSIKGFFEKLSNDSRFIIDSPDETLKRFTFIINDRIKPKLPLLFKNIPDSPIVVKEMPYDGPGGTYSFGSPDGSRPGVFYANVRRPKDNPTYNMVALALHEADPGHHLQDIYAQHSVGTPTFQKVIDYTKYFSVPYHFPFYTSFTEGWGLYAESLGEKDQLDIYKDDYEMMGRYSFEIFRACRLVVDTGLHYYNWSRDRAIEYMLNYTSFSRSSIEIEINRYITWPGQATAYKIGELKIKELRQKAMDALGPKFDIRDFHSVVLDNGAIPLSVLERLIDEWIVEVNTEADSLEKIMSEFWSWRMKNSPEFSTTLQMYKYNDQLNSYAYDKFETDRVGAQGFLDRLSNIDKSTLQDDKKISYDILKDMLDVFLAGYKWKDYEPLNPFNFLEGWTVGFDLFLSGTPFDTQGDFVNYARRLELAPKQLEEMMNLTRMAIANGHTSHNASISRVPKQLANMIQTDPVQSELYKPVNKSISKVFPDTKYRSIAEERIKDAIIAFMHKLTEVKTFIETEYMPKTRRGLGIGSLPNGKDNYKACLLFHTSIDISPEDVHNKGLSEVARIEKLVQEKTFNTFAVVFQRMNNIGFPSTTTIPEMYQNITKDTRFLLNTSEETLARFKSIIYDRIQPKISKYISNPPNLPLEVRASASDGVGGEYWTGTADGSRPGIFYANVHKPEYNPTYKMVSLSLHEAIPGHHLAESYGILSDVPEFRKHFEWISYNVPYFFPFYNAFAEGWALYAEFLGEEMGIYEDDYEMLGRYSDEMLRATRLVIDSGIHYYNWTRERAINYMLNYTAETADSAAIEIDRYATWPGQACGYKIGELKIKELRKKASDALGDKFNLADFHYTVLRNGAMPLGILETTVDEWISTVKHDQISEPPKCEDPITSKSTAIVCNIIILLMCLGFITLMV